MGRIGWIINTEDLTEELIYRLKDCGINELGIHPGGGKAAPALMKKSLETWKTPEYSRLVSLACSLGIEVEFDAHAVGYLLSDELFASHPDWFRADENGTRVPDHNLCASSEAALEYISERAREVARIIRTNTHRYPFWPDDVTKSFCHCEKCRKLTPSDQALKITNAFIRGIRRDDPQAIVPYLAYYETLAVPTIVKPEAGVYLEYAPIERDSAKPMSAPENAKDAAYLPALLELFGKQNSRALEYWVDNSRYSNWTRPPKKMVVDFGVVKSDAGYYRSLGFEDLTSFACFLGEDYIALFGEPPYSEYASAVLA